jgi:SAM-dependent methyltransferase
MREQSPSEPKNVAPFDWSATRGDKWLAHVSGMEAMLRPVDEPLFAALRLDAAASIAEIGCGGGGTALELLSRAPSGSRVHGFDISPQLVELARGRARAGDDRIAFEVADMAQAAPEKSYQRLLSRFGIMFFEEPAAAFVNLARWLEPAGRFAFAVWGPRSENPWLTSVRDVVAQVVEIPKQDPQAPGPFRYADGDSLLALLAAAGFVELEEQPWRGALAIGGGLPPAEAAQFALASFSSFSELLAQSGEAAFAAARRALSARFSEHQADGVVQLDACVRIFSGARA